MSPAGRRAGSPDTRGAILEAARSVFAERGYDRATIRAIAARADVDPALVHHYFGDKESLFATSINIPFTPAEMVTPILAKGDEHIGADLAALFFSVWEVETQRESLLGVLRSAFAGEEQAVTAFREFITTALQGRIAPRLEGPDASLRALLMASHLVGIAVTRYVVRLEPISSTPIEHVLDLVGPRLQSYVDGV